MPFPVYRTLGTLRSVLQARLGFSAAGASAGVNRTLLNDWLFQAQKELWYLGSWFNLNAYRDSTLGTGASTIDYHAALDPQRVNNIWIEINTQWQRLDEGLAPRHYSTMDFPGPPQRFERLEQIQFWPKADQAYQIRVWSMLRLPRFEQDADLPVIDDAMIMLHATTHGKEHYRHPDAASYRKDLDLLLSSLRGSTHKVSGIYRRGEQEVDFEPRPRVV